MKTIIFFLIISCQLTTAQVNWSRTYGGTQSDVLNDIIDNNDGTYMVCGSTSSIDLDINCTSHGSSDAWLFKINQVGDILWQKCYGGSFGDGFKQIIRTQDGGLFCLGLTNSNDGDVSGLHGSVGQEYGVDFWAVKLDSDGDIVWQKCIGSENKDTPYFVEELSDGSLVLFGQNFDATGDFDTCVDLGQTELPIVKLSPQGDILKVRLFGGSGNEYILSTKVINDTTYCISSTSSTDGDISDAFQSSSSWLLILDNNLNIIKSKTYVKEHISIGCFLDKINNCFYVGGSNITSGNNRIPWVGVINSEYDTIKSLYYPTGTMWQHSVGFNAILKNSLLYFSRETDDPGLIQYGGYNDIFIQIADTFGNVLGSQVYGTNGYDIVTSVILDQNDRLITCAYVDTTSDPLSYIFDGWIFSVSAPLSIEDFKNNNGYKVYPNPCTDKFIIESLGKNKEKTNNYKIIDLTGKEIQTGEIYSERQLIKLKSEIQTGSYLIQLMNNREQVFETHQLIIIK